MVPILDSIGLIVVSELVTLRRLMEERYAIYQKFQNFYQEKEQDMYFSAFKYYVL